ncbi:unnamed protein product [Diatraea saccharalis]|uniref:Tetratricopeptide SHNi-TPR domain-containing protein n=1 Tax=Diatraea saccharalis TaxID=40085 RepID=A0A9N9QYN2_9NEOP|nr:unnamed protein product [Diatraea saccharalis]
MALVPEVDNPSDLLSVGRRHYAVRDFSSAVETLARACEILAKNHGDTADECADAYLWYGKSLLGLSREESGVLGDGVPGVGNADNEDEENEDQEEDDDEEDEKNGENAIESEALASELDAPKPESTMKEEESKDAGSEANDSKNEPGPSNGEVNDESEVNLDNEDDVDNLQLAWEMLDLARSILQRRVQEKGDVPARSLLAEVYLTLGEVALESETYDKAVIDMQSCLELQKEVYMDYDRRIAETHYQIGLANSLASNFEDAITHFKNAANILETRIKMLENPETAKNFEASDPFYSIEAEIKELKELLPEIKEKIQDMMDYKAETIKRVRDALCPSNGEGASSSNTNGAGESSSTIQPKPAASDISHLIKRKRKSSEGDANASAPKRANT